MPTLTASAPASINASAASPVAMLPATTSNSPLRPATRATISTTARECPCAVSTTSTSTPESISACARSTASGPTPTAAPTRKRPCASFVACGNSTRFWMSLTVIRPVMRPSASTIGSFSMRCRCRSCSASRSVVPTGAVTRPSDGHQLGDGLREVALEAQVAVREDADEQALGARDRHAGDVVALHQVDRVGDERVGPQRHRLDDHPGLGALDLVDLADLRRDREIAVHDPEAALARERDRETRLGDGVHRRGDDRHLEHDRAREAGRGRDVVRQHRRLRRHEEHVVERQPFLRKLLRERGSRRVEGELSDVHPERVPATADEGATPGSGRARAR